MPNNVPLPLDPFHDPDMPGMAVPEVAGARAAVATIGRLLRKSPAELSTQPTYLKQWFRHFKNCPTGLTSKSLANCKTEIRYLVRKVCGRGRKSGFRPLAPEWVQLCGRAGPALQSAASDRGDREPMSAACRCRAGRFQV